MNIRPIVVLSSALLLTSCYTFSVFNSAVIVEPGRTQVIPSASLLSLSDGDESYRMTNNIGVQAIHGLNSRLNLGLRFERLFWHDDMGEGFNYLDFSIKASIVPDRMAISVPVGINFGDDIEIGETLQINPTLHLSYQINSLVFINFSPKLIYFIDGDGGLSTAYNFGVSIYSSTRKYFLTPEIGILNPADDQYYFQYGVGVGINI